LLQIALEENVDVVFIGAGLFLKKPEMPEGCTTKFVPKVSSARAARVIFNYWADKYNCVPDAIVIEGPMAGGHVGFKKNELLNVQKPLHQLIEETVEVMKPFEERFNIEIPVIAAGGVYSGQDMYDMLEAGASAVKMGSRFVTTTECDVSDEFKQTYLRASEEDITLIDSPVGLPGRVVSSTFVKKIQAGETMPVNCPWKCLKTCDYKTAPFCIAAALFNAAQGNMDEGFSFAGSKAYLADRIMSVKETIGQIMQEYTDAKQLALLKLNAAGA
jgi:NAD(P)H-dependent flavin oxidoreductase YrpB (nitropropane dioxygenase family)